MPVIQDKAVDFPADVSKKVPGWIFEHEWVGYLKTPLGYFIYRLPTIRECRLYRTASMFDPVSAVTLFLDRILLHAPVPIGRLKPAQAGQLVVGIIEEHYLRGDETVAVVDGMAEEAETDLAEILHTYIKAISPNTDVLDLNIEEIKRLVATAQAMTGNRILNGKRQEESDRGRRSQDSRVPQEEIPTGGEADPRMQRQGRYTVANGTIYRR